MKLILAISILASSVAFAEQMPTNDVAPKAPVAAPQSSAPAAEQAAVEASARKPIPPPTLILSRAIGEVGDHIVTSREVILSEAIDQAIGDKPLKTDKAAEAPRILKGDEKIFPAEDSKFLDVWIVYLEAKSLATQTVSRAELQLAIKKVQEKWSGNPAWQELEASNEELRDISERILVARAFEKLKSDPQLAPVSDDDALTYYRKNRLRFGSLPFPSLKDNIKAFLVKQQTEHRLAEWRDVLRHKYKVRNFIAG